MKDFPLGHASYRSQTRLWGYNPKLGSHETEFSDLQIEAAKPIQDQAATVEGRSPVRRNGVGARRRRQCDRQAGANGLLAPAGPVGQSDEHGDE